MLDNPTKEKQVEIAVRLFDNNTYGTTYGKGLYRRAVFNGTIDARSPTAKYLVDCYNYEDWCNIASTDQQITVLQVIPDECTLVSHLEFKKTPNPSSIIWENRATVDRNMQTKRSKKKKSKRVIDKDLEYNYFYFFKVQGSNNFY